MVKNEFRYYTYKVTFKDLPIYFYYGRKKDLGKPYLGSPKTFKHFWGQFEPEVQILCWYKTAKEAQEAEDSLIGHTWKQEWNGLRYSLNRNHKGGIDEEACKKGGKKNTQAQQEARKRNGKLNGKANGVRLVIEGKGMYSPEYLGSEEYLRQKKRGGEKTVVEGKGIHNPEYKNSEEYLEQKKRAGGETGRKYSKPVMCVETGAVYPSGAKAGEQTGIRPGNIRRAASSNGKLAAGGFHWLHVEGEK